MSFLSVHNFIKVNLEMSKVINGHCLERYFWLEPEIHTFSNFSGFKFLITCAQCRLPPHFYKCWCVKCLYKLHNRACKNVNIFNAPASRHSNLNSLKILLYNVIIIWLEAVVTAGTCSAQTSRPVESNGWKSASSNQQGDLFLNKGILS